MECDSEFAAERSKKKNDLFHILQVICTKEMSSYTLQKHKTIAKQIALARYLRGLCVNITNTKHK